MKGWVILRMRFTRAKKTTALDPLNTAILLELAKDQKAVGDLVGLASTKAKVLAINPGAPEISALNSL